MITEHVQLEIIAAVVVVAGQIIAVWRSNAAASTANESLKYTQISNKELATKTDQVAATLSTKTDQVAATLATKVEETAQRLSDDTKENKAAINEVYHLSNDRLTQWKVEQATMFEEWKAQQAKITELAIAAAHAKGYENRRSDEISEKAAATSVIPS